MLKPAILYKEQIIKCMQEYFGTDDMFYVTGGLGCWIPDIPDCPDSYRFQYAIVNKDNELIGYIDYSIDWYSSRAHDFALFSFDRGNTTVGIDAYKKLEELVSRFHRVEWRAISGNHACNGYDRFIEKHCGRKFVLKDAIRDKFGNYHDDIIYEIVNDIKPPKEEDYETD